MERSYSLRVIASEDIPEVIDFLSRFFFRDEPLNIETGMDLDYSIRCPEMEAYCTNSIPEGNSVMAYSNTNEVVGVCLSGGVRRNEQKDSSECTNDKFRKVMNLLIESDRQTDIFSRYPKLDSLLDVKIISVDTNWRGMGICKALLEKTREVAKEQGFQVVKVDCTSHISALAVSRLGFERIHVLKYCEFFDGGSEPVFKPPPPHFGVQVYIFKLDDI
ncbi:UNVERIFIED_CONTAM: hypothetical protein PYX00_009190 [Menopon gallinae]|uniref:aralkylamine N-acetyltransferase n=1 Tax=Menopon gallinae TaxID=328185 RepID=A0AAW2HAF6_9NEOP